MNKPQNTRERIIEIAERLLFQQGFSGTSLKDVMAVANLSKGAFFHHFKSKDELAHAVLERWADNDDALFESLANRAGSLAEDPLQEAVIFIKLLEEWLTELDEPLHGCLFASFTYESAKFDLTMLDYIHDRLGIWMGLYQGIFDRLAAAYETKVPDVSGRSLTEMFATLFEGGLILSRALDDRNHLARQLRQFRQMLVVMFEAS